MTLQFYLYRDSSFPLLQLNNDNSWSLRLVVGILVKQELEDGNRGDYSSTADEADETAHHPGPMVYSHEVRDEVLANAFHYVACPRLLKKVPKDLLLFRDHQDDHDHSNDHGDLVNMVWASSETIYHADNHYDADNADLASCMAHVDGYNRV